MAKKDKKELKESAVSSADSMTGAFALLRTKLYPLALVGDLCCRKRLHEQMDAGIQRPLLAPLSSKLRRWKRESDSIKTRS